QRGFAMKITFSEIENRDWMSFFENAFAGHDVEFVDALADVQADAEIVSIFIYSRVDAAFLDAHPRIKLIATRSTGHDHIDIEQCRQRGVAVCSVPSYGDHTVAEHTLALMLAAARRLQEAADARK